MKQATAIALALLAGVLLAIYDLRTDDTGVEVGLLLIASLLLALLAPRDLVRWMPPARSRDAVGASGPPVAAPGPVAANSRSVKQS